MLRRSLTHHLRRAQPYVIDMPCVPPPDPAADVLLSDLTWSNLENAFPGKVHAPVAASDSPQFQILATGLRAVGLLPVRTIVAKKPSVARWVPFLIDTGSHQTFFNDQSIKALALDVADHIEIFSSRVNLARSSHHFDDINLLGTDFLRYCELRVNYPAGAVQLDVIRIPSQLEFIVTDGTVALRVKPEHPDIMSLKDAIKAKCAIRFERIDASEIIIKHPDGTKMGDREPLRAGVEYVFEVPKL